MQMQLSLHVKRISNETVRLHNSNLKHHSQSKVLDQHPHQYIININDIMFKCNLN